MFPFSFCFSFVVVAFDGYYVAYKPITLSCILVMFIEIYSLSFLCDVCNESMSMCND